jgi:hypothetical protein
VTKKDFELIRDVVRTIKDEKVRHETATTFAVLLKKQNPRFNTLRFVGECFNTGHSVDPLTKRKLDRLRDQAARLGKFEA